MKTRICVRRKLAETQLRQMCWITPISVMLFFVFFCLLNRPIQSCEPSKCNETSSVPSYRLQGHVFNERRAETMHDCIKACDEHRECLSVSYKLMGPVCELNKADVHIAPQSYIPAKGYVYSNNPWPKIKMVRSRVNVFFNVIL